MARRKRQTKDTSGRRLAPRAAALVEAEQAAVEAEAEARRLRRIAEREARSSKRRRTRRRFRPIAWAIRWMTRLTVLAGALLLAALGLFAFVNPPTTPYMLSESARLGGVERTWIDLDDMTPALARAVVAAEDANFCLHWGLDLQAIQQAMEAGANRGASTISQQVVKNLFLWQGRSWFRKALEATITPVMELVWTKHRILEVYLNIAEFGEGVFGVEAAAQHWYGRSAAELTASQAAALAVILPSPKTRDPRALSSSLNRLARQAAAGGETIAIDGRAACFQP